jgi:hypothetical protein
MHGWSPKVRVMSAALWAVVTGLGVFMLERGAWALLQPWGSTAEKLFALGFFAALTAFAGYKLRTALLPTDPIGGRLREELAYGLVSLVFVIGALFVYFRGDGSASELFITTLAGVALFGAGAVMFFLRARRP